HSCPDGNKDDEYDSSLSLDPEYVAAVLPAGHEFNGHRKYAYRREQFQHHQPQLADTGGRDRHARLFTGNGSLSLSSLHRQRRTGVALGYRARLLPLPGAFPP